MKKDLKCLLAIILLVAALGSDWLDWHMKDNNPVSSPMNASDISALKGILVANNLTLPAIIPRIDKYHLKFHASHIHSDSHISASSAPAAVSKHFFYAWYAEGCNGLTDFIWSMSNGGTLVHMVRDEVTRLRRFGVLKRGGVAIDIGSNIGDSTIPMAMLASKTIAFDPSVSVYEILVFNTAINKHLNIDSYNMAVGDKDGELEFEYAYNKDTNIFEFECNGGVAKYGDRKRSDHLVKRKSVVLKSFLEKTYGASIIPRVEYIKIDCEGYDTTILKSISDLIAAIEPKPSIQIEYFYTDMHEDHAVPGREHVGAHTLEMIKTILALPEKYTLFCTHQCNDGRHCDFATNRQIDITEVSGGGGGSFKITYTDPAMPGPVDCADFMLLPRHILSSKKKSLSVV